MSGYHLQKAGADATFLLRPKRVEKLSRPQVLYSYDDASLKQFSGYRVTSSAADAVGDLPYDYLIVILDRGCRALGRGHHPLARPGHAVRSMSVVTGGVGFALREHLRRYLRLSDERVLDGSFGLSAHQVASADLPATRRPTPRSWLRPMWPAGTWAGELRRGGHAREPPPFKALYDACDVSHCDVFQLAEKAAFSATTFAAFAGVRTDGLAPIRPVRRPQRLGLAIEAAREVASLDKYGPVGLAVASRLSSETVMHTFTAYEGRTLPLDWNAFSAYHHAGKVGQLDLEPLQDHVTARERQGKPMPSLRRLIADLPAFRRCASTSRDPGAKRDS